MRICVFEDAGVRNLEPLTLTRPAFDLRCGAGTLLERQLRAVRRRARSACWCGRSWPTCAGCMHPDMRGQRRGLAAARPGRRWSTPAGCRRRRSADRRRTAGGRPGRRPGRLRRPAGRRGATAVAGASAWRLAEWKQHAAASRGRRRA